MLLLLTVIIVINPSGHYYLAFFPSLSLSLSLSLSNSLFVVVVVVVVVVVSPDRHFDCYL